MSETKSRLGRTIGNLLLALLNATLILVALCLFLGWQLFQEVETVTGHVAKNVTQIQDLKTEVQAMTAEMSALRSELSEQSVQADPLTLQAMQELSAKMDRIDGRVSQAETRLASFVNEPTALIDHAVDQTAGELKELVAAFADCPAASKE